MMIDQNYHHVCARGAFYISSSPSTGKRQVGPTFPSYAPTYDPTTYHGDEEEDDDDDDFGPKPLLAGNRDATRYNINKRMR